MPKKLKRKILFAIFKIGFCIPQGLKMPVAGANSNNYHPESFWYYPCGKSIVHHGVDIFAQKGTEIRSDSIGLVIFKDPLSLTKIQTQKFKILYLNLYF